MPPSPPVPLAFHAAPPAGTWSNDPNGLVQHDGQWRLFVQHRDDAPAFRATGWARMSSPDLLRWTFDAMVIPPDSAGWHYSGCVTATGAGLEAIHTLHAAGLEQQVVRTSSDGGSRWSAPEALPSLGAPAANRRDPFLFTHRGQHYLLLAEPCDWTRWAETPASRLALYASPDRRDFTRVATLGPWSPPGVMWEVPVLLFVDGHAVLLVSTVDRRGDGARCGVRAWVGSFDADGFRPHPAVPADGQPVDFGPDFYALIPAGDLGIAWLSSWQTARTMAWPGFAGGPASLPRRLVIDTGAGVPRLGQRVPPSIAARFSRPVTVPPAAGLATASWHGDLSLAITGPSGTLAIAASQGENRLSVRRRGPGIDWAADYALGFGAAAAQRLQLFIDGPLCEVFLPDASVAISAVLAPMPEPALIAAHSAGRPLGLAWAVLP